MTKKNIDVYNRMTAKRIRDEHCRFCGSTTAPLVKTRCCEEWICCDKAYVSYQGGGYCQVEHERFSLCHSHYSDGHQGHWETCVECKRYWSPEDYKTYSSHKPKY